jgi:hypothetical protein
MQNFSGRSAGYFPATLIKALPRAVVQGLSEVSAMQDFTIGTGLGNALFANRKRRPA